MSHLPRPVTRAGAAECQTTGIPFSCIPKHSMPALAMDAIYVPLAQRTADQLQTKADELRRMAATASTADVVNALLTLADRYASLAEKRRMDSNA